MRAPSPNIDGMGSLLYSDGTARFRIWAPNASRVQLFGDFTGGVSANALDLAPEPRTGNWSADQIPVAANDKYQYIITNMGGVNNIAGVFYRTDARAQQVQSSAAASQGYVIDPSLFTSNRQPFTSPAPQDFLIYQLHIGSFAGKNDGIAVNNNIATFVDVISKLDYVRGLGFNAIELLPISDFRCDLPGITSDTGAGMGYGPCDLFASEDAYATSPEKAVTELIQLIDAAHAKGLAVILDIVHNHASQPDNRYWQYDGNDEGYNLDDNGQPILGGIYFVKGHHTPWGEGFALWQQEVKDLLLDNARMYLRDFRVDGFRFDAVQAIQPDAVEYIISALQREHPGKYLIAEYNPGDINTSVITSPYPDAWGDLHFSAIWDLGSCGDAVNALSGFGTEGIVNNQRLFSDPNNWHKVMYLTGSHDQVSSAQGNTGLYFAQRFGGRTNGWALAKARLAWSLNAILPATPMMFMGTEGHIDGSWNPVVGSWGDLRLDWAKIGDPTGAPMQQLVRDINHLRWTHDALRTANGFITQDDKQNQVVAFKRFNSNGDVLLAVVNAGDGIWTGNDYQVSLSGDDGAWGEVFNSQAPIYGGVNTVGNFEMRLTAFNGCIGINLPCWSLLVFVRL